MAELVQETLPQTHVAGGLAIASGIASVVLLAYHPGGQPHGFADLLKQEAANQVADAIVHGSFILVLAAEVICYSVMSLRLGMQRMTVLAGLVLFVAGAMFMSGSLVVDGLIVPAVAAKYAAAPAAQLDYAKSLFVLLGAALKYLMPIGLLLQASGVFSWSMALVAGSSRAIGIAGLLQGGLSVAGLLMAFVQGNAFVLMGVIVALAVWAVAAGSLMLRRSI
jgi:hypothetical protein